MNELRNLVRRVASQLYADALLRCALLAGSLYLLAFTALARFTGDAVTVSLLFAVAGLVAGMYITGAYRDKKPVAVAMIHQTLDNTEYSLALLEKEEMNMAERLQIDRLLFKLNNSNPDLDFPLSKIYSGIGPYVLFFVFSAVVYLAVPALDFSSPQKNISKPLSIHVAGKLAAPVLQNASVLVFPPAYTGLQKKKSADLNISALAGSSVKWEISFDHAENLSVRLAGSNGEETSFKGPAAKDGHLFTHSDKINSSGLYSLRAYRFGSLVYQSDFYKLEAVADKAPVIGPVSKELYRYHHYKDSQSVHVQADVSDDFSIDQAYIVATVARGSGENVKFREVKFPLSPSHFKQARLEKTIDLKELNFAPGDELYYYWAAVDNKRPGPNFTKSDTYFIVYKDTTESDAAELATMALDLMPEYFRSQRQIIIDTQKLIAKRKKITKAEFNSASNEIGFDQKVLRLRYGQYLGEEFESNIGGSGVPGQDKGNILASFEHKSDASEDDGFRQQKKKKEETHAHEDAHSNSEKKDPLVAMLEQYGHSHDDDEAETFYEESTKNMLKMALEQMWQSELHLRMYEPEKAVPFETKALEYLKGAQQKVRAFVKKSGFDPPPIKEKEKRLTGELEDIHAEKDKGKTYESKPTAQLAAELLGYLEYGKLNQKQLAGIQASGMQLSQLVLQGKNGSIKDWPVLTALRKLMAGKSLPADEKQKLKAALFAFSERSLQKGDIYLSESKLEKAFWQGLR